MTSPVHIESAQPFVESDIVYPAEYAGHFSGLLISHTALQGRIAALAKQLAQDYHGKRPLFICTLKGACPFFVHLLDALKGHRVGFDLEFVRASSYEGTNSSGKVRLELLDLQVTINRHLIVVEDIIDTGTTLSHILPKFDRCQSVQVVTLLDKRLDVPKPLSAKYIGFSIPNAFVIGYGLDYNELYRDLRDIMVISQAGIDFDATKLHSSG